MGVASAFIKCTKHRGLITLEKSFSAKIQLWPGISCNFSSSPKPVRLTYSTYDKLQWNSGSPVVIMHGLMGSRGNWNAISKAINTKIKRKVFAVDARNHGDSPHTHEMTYYHMAEDLKKFVNDHNLGRVSAIGHSMGGRAMMLLALLYPELVNKLVIVDISPIVSSPSLNLIKQYLETMQRITFEDRMPLSAARKHVDQKLASLVQSQPVRQFLITNVTQSENGQIRWRVNLDTILHNYSEIVTFPKLEATFEGPTCFIGGGNSDYLRQEDEPEIQKLFPNAIFQYIPGAGHWVHSEKPSEFVEMVCKFLEEK